ncbi:bifunctional 4-hydroxy-2-oxoglutarate aldolase/2-dehydro-3-deoxy-phosphogluconate aldolase [Curtobacterium ammoniigenes]|uniref:bifunctional 4-hydroxy-2-oxoglutarate aldolase/2-dehydro-3-deoxy-phosphogluconate aldolase n=1 Tax=Curtobacterium ammoniigenes TaxID=395387 RepID=UPI00082DC777|nr:bifunctional 4-hydroxy-2-oxoglutarate aldolase/2-dehydro-3-deoxy-phosphogluconate aldolase [Curtobacterium ammoniigenes]
MIDNAGFDALFDGSPLMAILRSLGVERSLAVAQTAWDLGIDLVEVTIQRPADREALHAVVQAGNARGRAVGAGTVVTVAQVRQAADAGAAFVVSPGLDLDIVHATAYAGLLPLPGVATPTEVQRAMSDGLTWMKVFPASVLGPGWLTAMRGPFPEARFVTTGGMDASNAPKFLAAGARVVAVGSALEDPSQLPRLAELVRRA